MNKYLLPLQVALILAQSTPVMSAQFTNLNFESANLPSIPPGEFGTVQPISLAMPGWVVFVGPDPIDVVLHNNATIGTAAASIYGPFFPSSVIFEGSYTIVLAPGASPFTGQSVGVSIEQTGLVPADALSLQFLGGTLGILPPTERFGVYVNGQELDSYVLTSHPNFINTFGVDVSAFAGQEATLRITSFVLPGEPNSLGLDALTFSPVAVPEPGVLRLLALAGLAFGVHRWRAVRK